MVIFWLAALLMVAVALAFLLPPLLRKGQSSGVERDALNVALFRDRMEELEGELEEGSLSRDEFEQARDELRRDLLVNTGASPETPAPAGGSGRWASLVVGVAVPVLALLIYLQLGDPGVIGRPAVKAAAGNGMSELIDALEKKLQSDPSNVKGWVLLGRSLMEVERYGEAVKVFERANKLSPDTPQILTEYAEALAMAQGGSLRGRPSELIDRALKVDPNSHSALWFAGLRSAQQGDYTTALGQWNRLLKLLPADGDAAKTVKASIEQVRKDMASAGKQPPAKAATPSAAATSSGVEVHVALGGGLKANPNATVFIFAKVPNGPPMPLAAVRRTVADLPLTVKLTPLMQGGQPLTSYPQLQLTARISASGDATARSGDLEGEVVAKPDGPVEITIDRKLP